MLTFMLLCCLFGDVVFGKNYAGLLYSEGGGAILQQNFVDFDIWANGEFFLQQEDNNEEQNGDAFLWWEAKDNLNRIIRSFFPIVFKYFRIQQIHFPFCTNLSPPLPGNAFPTFGGGI